MSHWQSTSGSTKHAPHKSKMNALTTLQNRASDLSTQVVPRMPQDFFGTNSPISVSLSLDLSSIKTPSPRNQPSTHSTVRPFGLHQLYLEPSNLTLPFISNRPCMYSLSLFLWLIILEAMYQHIIPWMHTQTNGQTDKWEHARTHTHNDKGMHNDDGAGWQWWQ